MPFDPDDCRTKPAATGAEAEPGMEVLDAFSLFCAYHLGITRDNGYRFQSVQEVARRFGVDVNTIKQRLTDYDLETEALRRLGFDTQLAQLDMQVAPEGVSRRELAKTLWQEVQDQRPPREAGEVDDANVDDGDVDDGDIDDDGEDDETAAA